MSWYAKNAADIGFVALLALAFLGVLVTFVRDLVNRSGAKWAFSFTFLVLAAIAWHANRVDRGAFETRLTGGDNFAFVRVLPDLDLRGQNRLALTTTGVLPSLWVGVYPIGPDGKTRDNQQSWAKYNDLVRDTFHFLDMPTVQPGKSQITFKMGDKVWIEHLEFERAGREIFQKFWVERDRKEIYREPKP